MPTTPTNRHVIYITADLEIAATWVVYTWNGYADANIRAITTTIKNRISE
jgi:hypothetical protein